MSNRITNTTIHKINDLYQQFGTWLAAAEYLVQQAGEPIEAAATVSTLLNKASRGQLKTSPRLAALLGQKRRPTHRLVIRFKTREEQTAVEQWLHNQGYTSLNRWFRAEIRPLIFNTEGQDEPQ